MHTTHLKCKNILSYVVEIDYDLIKCPKGPDVKGLVPQAGLLGGAENLQGGLQVTRNTLNRIMGP